MHFKNSVRVQNTGHSYSICRGMNGCSQKKKDCESESIFFDMISVWKYL